MSVSRTGKINWEPVKDKIFQLYCEDRVTLDKLPEIMYEEHGFKAGRRSYCNKLVEWGWNRSKYKRRRARPVHVQRPVVAIAPAPRAIPCERPNIGDDGAQGSGTAVGWLFPINVPSVARKSLNPVEEVQSLNTTGGGSQVNSRPQTPSVDKITNNLSALHVQEEEDESGEDYEDEEEDEEEQEDEDEEEFGAHPQDPDVANGPAANTEQDVSLSTSTCPDLGCSGLLCFECSSKYLLPTPRDEQSGRDWVGGPADSGCALHERF